MQSSDVSAYLNLLPSSDVTAAKRAETGYVAAQGPKAPKVDTTSVSAGAKALTVPKQAEVASQLSVERLAQLRAARPEPERIAQAILRAELDDTSH